MTIFLYLIFVYLFNNQVCGQYETGIIFKDVYEETVNIYRQDSKQNFNPVPRYFCFCTVPGVCPKIGLTTGFGADLRITNQDPAPENCTIGLEVCCISVPEVPNTTALPPTTKPTTVAPTTTEKPPSIIKYCYCFVPGTCVLSVFGPDFQIVDPSSSADKLCPPALEVCCVAQVGPVTPTIPPTPSPPTAMTSPMPPTTPTPAIKSCGIRRIPPKNQTVIGRASFGAYPWQAAILQRDPTGRPPQFVGSGALLHPRYILTSAHKVYTYKNNVSELIVRLGDWDLEREIEQFRHVSVSVAEIVVHQEFNSYNLENNLAVVRLSQDVDLAFDHLNTVCRPPSPPTADARCWVSGWGKNIFEPMGSFQPIMREVEVPIMDNDECETRLRLTRLGGAFVLNRKSFMCAGGEPRRDACTGDGGAPLVCKDNNNQWYVVGLVAWGIGCGNPGVPGVYTNVYSFMSWIDQNIPKY